MDNNTLATHGDLQLVRLAGGEVVVYDKTRNAWSPALHHSEISALIADPSLMTLTDTFTE